MTETRHDNTITYHDNTITTYHDNTITTYHVVIVIIILITLLFIASRYSSCTSSTIKSENFDTHRNHSLGARTFYRNQGQSEISLDTAERDAKYEWGHRDPIGLTMYDHFYESKMLGEYDYNQYSSDYQKDKDTQYDLKFETSDRFKYSQDGMREPQLRGHFRGNIITLPQKLKW